MISIAGHGGLFVDSVSVFGDVGVGSVSPWFPRKVLGLVGIGQAPVGCCDMAEDVVQAAREWDPRMRLGSSRRGTCTWLSPGPHSTFSEFSPDN